MPDSKALKTETDGPVYDGPKMLLQVKCGCNGRRTIPLNIRPSAVFWLKGALADNPPPPDLVLQDYRCADCGITVDITFRHMGLASS